MKLRPIVVYRDIMIAVELVSKMSIDLFCLLKGIEMAWVDIVTILESKMQLVIGFFMHVH
jgi:hypothetical protein